MIVIGIDPGTSCGWAVLSAEGDRIASGTWDLQAKRHEGGGMRYLRLRGYLREAFASLGSAQAILGYEEVARHLGTAAAHVYGGIVSILTSMCEAREVPYRGVPVGTVKKQATGKGNANKDRVLEAARERWAVDGLTHDEADALWVAETLRREVLS